MAKMNHLTEFISTVLWTGYLSDENPTSIFIIGIPEVGKTRLVEKFRNNKGVRYFTDVTAWGITDTILPAIKAGEDIHHIIIPDFLNCVVKNRSTAEKLIMFLNALTEEGITNIATYANRGIPKNVSEKEKNYAVKCGVVTCITKNEYSKRKKRWQSLGFLSRFLPIQYRYSSGYVNNILTGISEGVNVVNHEINLNFPDKKQTVKLPEDISKPLIPLAKAISASIDAYGIRLLKIFNALLKANALKNGRKIVTKQDYDDLMKYIEFIKYKSDKTTTIDE